MGTVYSSPVRLSTMVRVSSAMRVRVAPLVCPRGRWLLPTACRPSVLTEAIEQLRLDRVEHVVGLAVPLLGVAPAPLLEVRVAPEQPLLHRRAVDLLLEPVGQP